MCEKGSCLLAVAGAHPFVGRDEAQVSALFQELPAAFVEEAIDVARAGKGFIAAALIELCKAAAVVLELYVRRVADNDVKAARAVRAIEYIGKPRVPKEEMRIGLQVDVG